MMCPLFKENLDLLFVKGKKRDFINKKKKKK